MRKDKDVCKSRERKSDPMSRSKERLTASISLEQDYPNLSYRIKELFDKGITSNELNNDVATSDESSHLVSPPNDKNLNWPFNFKITKENFSTSLQYALSSENLSTLLERELLSEIYSYVTQFTL